MTEVLLQLIRNDHLPTPQLMFEFEKTIVVQCDRPLDAMNWIKAQKVLPGYRLQIFTGDTPDLFWDTALLGADRLPFRD